MIGNRPANNFARGEIYPNAKAELAFGRSQVCYVTCPSLIGLERAKVSIELVGSDNKAMVAIV